MENLNKIQKGLKAPKGQTNSFGNYRYRSCEDILEAVKPLLDKGTTVTLSDEICLIGDRYYIKAIATIKNGEQSESVTAYARESLDKKGMDSAQITGAASSYARKYALNGLFLIDDTKDADTQDNRTIDISEPKTSKKEISDALLKQVADSKNVDELKKIWESNKGLGKEFAKIITERKKFLLAVAKSEKEDAAA